MSGPLDFTNENIENTYQRVLQTDGTSVYDGTGSLFPITAVAAPAGPDQSVQFNDAGATSGSGNFTFDKNTNIVNLTGSIIASSGFTGSLLGTAATASYTPNAVITASVSSNVITFTKGDGSTFPLTVDTGSGGSGTTSPGAPNLSIQFNGNGAFSGSSNFTFDSASNTMTLTGSMVTTGSNLLIGATTLTGSFSVTGSTLQVGNNTLLGNTQLTGSVGISGSTLQVGNNTLLGNTLLSGSITISGSYPVGSFSSSVNIYGDTSMTGYLKFNPNPTNIDTTISASYVYVSGSTNDLYFAQNTKGYSNITRLRWIEGNMYSGLLSGGLIGSSSSTVYTIESGSGIIVNLNASLSDDPYPTIKYINWPTLSASIAPLSASYDQTFVAISSSGGTGTIFAQGTPFYDGQYDTLIPIGLVLHQNHSTIGGVKTQPNVAYGLSQRANVFIKAFGPLKITGFAVAPSGSSTGSLTIGAGTAYADGANYPVDPNNPSYIVDPGTNVSKIWRYYDSGSQWVYDTNNGAGYPTIDPTRYSLNGVLTAVPGTGANRQWTNQRVFWFPNSTTKAIIVYYGNATYASQVEAIAESATEVFTEAPNTAANAVYLGYITVRNNATFTDATSFKIAPSGLFRGSGGGGGGGGGTTIPGGTNTQIQYNNNGVFGGVSNLTWDGTNLYATGSFTGSFTGSLLGTASYATTASYALNGGVTQIIAGPNISLSPSNGLGQVTVSSTGGGGIGGNTSTGSYGSFYSDQTQTTPTINTPTSMSFNQTDISNGVYISGSTSSSIKIANAGVYNIQFSAQIARSVGSGTENVFIWLKKNGSDLSWTNTDITLAGGTNVRQVAAWNWFANAAAGDYYELMWSATSTNLELQASTTPNPDVPSVILTVNRVDQFLSNTGSFTGSFTGQLIGTASWASQSVSSSYALSSSYAYNASNAYYATTANYANSAGYASSAGGISTYSPATIEQINVGEASSDSYNYIVRSQELEQSKHTTINIFNYLNF